MGDPACHYTTLRNKFELERRHYADRHFEASTNTKHGQKQRVGTETEEIVKHMSSVPSFLERGKPVHDKALSFGVMDWGRLEKWQYRRLKPGVGGGGGNHRFSPLSSRHSSPLFSTDGSSPQSSSGYSRSPARPKHHRVTLQSHLNIPPKEIPAAPFFQSCSENLDEFKDLYDASRGCGMSDSCAQNAPGSKFPIDTRSGPPTLPPSLKGKMKIQDGLVDPAHGIRAVDKNSTPSSKNSDVKTGNAAAGKQRSRSPLRRFSFSLSSTTKAAESSPVSQNPARAHSSPLRRLLDPLFPSKATVSRQSAAECRQDPKVTPKTKLDFRAGDESRRAEKNAWSIKQAVFQTVVKNGWPLFTFAVENDDILAATLRSLSSSGKDGKNGSIYTFFTIREAKKKNGNWLSPGGNRSKDQGYVPDVAAQMKVSGSLGGGTVEFVLFSVDPSRFDHQAADVKPRDELAAVIVEFSRKAVEEDDRFVTTVVLPGGSHGVPCDGEPSPLAERWRSGGACDCGGWDMGCRLRTLTNQTQSSRQRSTNVHTKTGRFELFFQGEVPYERPFFSLSPLKEGIFSVDYDSSLSLLQAFSICISVVECRKASGSATKEEEVPVRCAPFPPLSPVARA